MEYPEPAIDNVKTLDQNDFDEMKLEEEDSEEHQRIVYMRLGSENWSCKHCSKQSQNISGLEKHLKSSHWCDVCDEEFSDKDQMIVHLKNHIQSLLSLQIDENKSITKSNLQTLNKNNPQHLEQGFYHPTIRQPDRDWRKEKFVGGVSILKSKNKKPKTQYYIYKEKGKIKKVVKTVFKPKAKEESKRGQPSVEDELSCNLDDLLKTFEVEESEKKDTHDTPEQDPLMLEIQDSSSEASVDEKLPHQEDDGPPTEASIDEKLPNQEYDGPPTEASIDEKLPNQEYDGPPTEASIDEKLPIQEDNGLPTIFEGQFLHKNPKDEVSTKSKISNRHPKKRKASKETQKNIIPDKKSKCLVCNTQFLTFGKLLWHITNKHFKSEMNNIITAKYPGFWRSEKLKESKEHVCLDCGHRMLTRAELHRHLGVDHNLLWDIYLKAVQSCKKTTASSTTQPKSDSSSASQDSFPKQTREYMKGRKSKQELKQKIVHTTGSHSEIILTRNGDKMFSSFYKDQKLSLIPDENPYSKKFIFGGKARISTDIHPSTDRSSLLETIATNVASSLQEPYCSVCQLLLEPEARAKLGETATKSLEKVPAQSSVWIPTGAAGTSLISPLLVCRRCKLCVHKHCYNDAIENPDDWTCDGCSEKNIDPNCAICLQPSGTLRLTTRNKLVHVTCAMLVPEVRFTGSRVVDVSGLPTKRSSVECLVCGETGRPIVHCQASRDCKVALHTDCAVKDNVDVVIGTEPGSVIMRCSFCVEKYNLCHQISSKTLKYPVNDLQIGETVTVTRTEGGKSIGVIIEIISDEYYSVAFDDGTYCDNLEPKDVTFVNDDLEHVENCPVSVVFEGETFSGVFKESNKLFWYKVQTLDKMDTLELERACITKNTC